MLNKFCQKKWDIRNTSDPEYKKLGETEDFRRERADAIERECRYFWFTIVVTIIIIVFSIIF